ncbi:MAG: KamA family radical SAM protein [Bacillota bacterium]
MSPDINHLLQGGAEALNLTQLTGTLKRDGFIVRKRLELFWEENPVFHQLVQESINLEAARRKIYNYLAEHEKRTLKPCGHSHPMDRALARRAINVLKNIFAERSEELAGFSVLETLMKLAHHQEVHVHAAFVEELRHLFLAMKEKTGLFEKHYFLHSSVEEDPRAKSTARSAVLDEISGRAHLWMSRYSSGLDPKAIKRRELNRIRIMRHFGAGEEDWADWTWHCGHVIRDIDTLKNLISLTPEEEKAVRLAREKGLPFGITPYYVSLMDFEADRNRDHALRAQVIPPVDYVMLVSTLRHDTGKSLDFMGEHDTSPETLITRRYPMIAILKPYNTCAQICVYCQRNWEITDVMDKRAEYPDKVLDRALNWLARHPEVTEVLITGGDPGIMSDEKLKALLDRLAEMDHVNRIRIGTRLPVVLPMRITEEYAGIISAYHVPGRREVAVMTHFEHPYEVTPDTMEAVQKLRRRGVPVYNQGVFTYENARRFEMAALRKTLRLIGVEPYYTFNAKGKEETRAYRVPIARLLQEQAEEARLSPGLDRTDEAVFNIPRLGKNYLRAGQDHEVIMIMPDGSRLYEFYPWDHSTTEGSPYLHRDVPVLDFLGAMGRRGENPVDYRSIWYY